MIRFLLLSVMCVGVSSQPITENQRLFTMAVGRVRHLHLVANDLFNEFENSLQVEDQRQLNKIFLQDFCHSDYFMSPIDKHETQRSSVLKLLSISYGLVESWEISSSFLVAGFVVKTQVTSKLSELKTGLMKLIEAYQDGEGSSESLVLQLAPYRYSYQTVEVDDSFKRNYELFACFKKDMHKVETYLAVAKCRLSPETNCTL